MKCSWKEVEVWLIFSHIWVMINTFWAIQRHRENTRVEITLVLGNVTGDSSFPSGQMDVRRQIPWHKSSMLLLMATRHVTYSTSVRCHPCILYLLSWFAKAGHVHVTNPSMWYLLSMCVLSLPEANEISCWSSQISCHSHKLSKQDSAIFFFFEGQSHARVEGLNESSVGVNVKDSYQ